MKDSILTLWIAHILNLGAQDTLKLLKVKTRDRNILTSFNKNHCLSDESDESEDDENDFGLNANIDKSNNMRSVITKVRNICKKIRISEVLTKDLKDFCTPLRTNCVKPILDCKTSWNSTCCMIEIFPSLKPAMKMMIENSN